MALSLGCNEDVPPVPVVVPAVVQIVIPPPPAVPAASSSAVTGVRVTPEYTGVSSLYRGFFSDRDALVALGGDLGECVSQGVSLLVAYDTEKRHGRITVSVPRRALVCVPRATDLVLDVSVLTPISRALARYRDSLSEKYDIRIASFEVGILVIGSEGSCRFVAQGGYPPSGNQFSPCIGVDGGTCASRVAHKTQLAWANLAMKAVAESCLK